MYRNTYPTPGFGTYRPEEEARVGRGKVVNEGGNGNEGIAASRREGSR